MAPSSGKTTTHADLDLLCVAVYCTADDLLPEPGNNARRELTDTEVVTLAVAQAAIGIPVGTGGSRGPRAGPARSPV